jgi:hypothetical protein
LRDFFRAPINLLGFSSKRHAVVSLFLADSDLNSLFALSQDQLQEVAQFRVALSPFRSARRKDFASGFLAFDFPDCHFRNPMSFSRLIRESERRFRREAVSDRMVMVAPNRPRAIDRLNNLIHISTT